MNSVEILDKKEELRNKANAIINTCKTEVREMTDDEKKEVDDYKAQIRELNTELEELKNKLQGEEYDEVAEEDENENKEHRNQNKEMEKRSFSLLSAIRNSANNKTQDALTQSIIDMGATEMRKAGLNYVGQIQLPMESRAVTVAVEHDDVIATDLFDVVGPLQKKNVLVNAGAKFLTGLVSDVQYPVMSSINCTWEGETASASASTPTFTNVKLQPKRLTVVVPISKQFLIQDSVGAENAIREEIVNAINSKLEDTILGEQSGSTTEPKGIFSYVAPTAVADFASLVDKESDIEDANVYGEMTYVMSPKAKSALRAMAKGTKSTQLVYENGEVDGVKAYSTTHVGGKKYVFGDWSNYIIGQWGNIDITVDNVTLAAEGQIRLVVNAYFDAKPLRPEAFTCGTLA